MKVVLNTQRGSITTRTPETRFMTLRAGVPLSVSDDDALWLMARYHDIIEYIEDTAKDERPAYEPVVPAEPDEPEAVDEATEEPIRPEKADDTNTSGAISVADLSKGGKRGGSRRRSRRTT